MHAKAAAENDLDAVNQQLLPEASLSPVSRRIPKKNASDTEDRTKAHVKPERRGRPPRGKRIRQEPSRYYQFLSGHTAIGAYPCDKIHKTESNECGWCGSGKRESRHHKPERRYRPPRGKRVRQEPSRYYQFLSGHAAIGAYRINSHKR